MPVRIVLTRKDPTTPVNTPITTKERVNYVIHSENTPESPARGSAATISGVKQLLAGIAGKKYVFRYTVVETWQNGETIDEELLRPLS